MTLSVAVTFDVTLAVTLAVAVEASVEASWLPQPQAVATGAHCPMTIRMASTVSKICRWRNGMTLVR